MRTVGAHYVPKHEKEILVIGRTTGSYLLGAKSGPHQFFDAGFWAGLISGGEHDSVGINLFVTERNEGEDGVAKPLFLGGGGTAFRREGRRSADFVLQLDDEPLGGFFTDAAQGRKSRGIARSNGITQCRDRCAAEDVEGEFWADAADADEQQEHFTFLGSGETEQLLRAVLSNDMMIRE